MTTDKSPGPPPTSKTTSTPVRSSQSAGKKVQSNFKLPIIFRKWLYVILGWTVFVLFLRSTEMTWDGEIITLYQGSFGQVSWIDGIVTWATPFSLLAMIFVIYTSNNDEMD